MLMRSSLILDVLCDGAHTVCAATVRAPEQRALDAHKVAGCGGETALMSSVEGLSAFVKYSSRSFFCRRDLDVLVNPH